jgi:hypothetical protein
MAAAPAGSDRELMAARQPPGGETNTKNFTATSVAAKITRITYTALQ